MSKKKVKKMNKKILLLPFFFCVSLNIYIFVYL